ncbi:MAG: energy transducer TonB, partial [Acidobacteria bacterium]
LPVAYATGMIPGGIPGGARNGILNGMLGAPPNPLAPPAPPLPSHATHTIHPVRIGGGVQQASLIRQVRPQYPPLAKQARIQGAVVLEAVISKQGTIVNLKVISGHPWLILAALDAVRHWKYKPTLLNDEPVEVVTNITVNFSLDG